MKGKAGLPGLSGHCPLFPVRVLLLCLVSLSFKVDRYGPWLRASSTWVRNIDKNVTTTACKNKLQSEGRYTKSNRKEQVHPVQIGLDPAATGLTIPEKVTKAINLEGDSEDFNCINGRIHKTLACVVDNLNPGFSGIAAGLFLRTFYVLYDPLFMK
ncbi:hypothetical protein V6N11_004405 [Hibiscus sabdariffa]|uniref:Uncharacterized protein n=1 Tax=Hibiscus sabdariffa TaxID=183260 RepID=A0ABR2SH26_9ROSI